MGEPARDASGRAAGHLWTQKPDHCLSGPLSHFALLRALQRRLQGGGALTANHDAFQTAAVRRGFHFGSY